MEFEISLNNLRFYSYHGVFNEERVTGNEFEVNLTIKLPYKEEMNEDRLDYTVSYADLFSIVKKEMDRPRKLLETVAIEIVKGIQRKFPELKGGSIEIEKKRPPIPEMIGTASVKLIF